MSQHDFAALAEQYPEIINQMPVFFTAHQFILELARQNQREYIEALYTYREGNPFQSVHQQLAALLNRFLQLVERHGDEQNSRDIWTNEQGCSRWRRLPRSQP